MEIIFIMKFLKFELSKNLIENLILNHHINLNLLLFLYKFFIKISDLSAKKLKFTFQTKSFFNS